MKIEILNNTPFLKWDGTFNKMEALLLSGKIAGICYDKEGFEHLKNEPITKTERRIDLTLNNGHHSVYDHIMISFNMQEIPKILAMVINNEHQYTTSEKSARYTPVIRKENSDITELEETLYQKWLPIFENEIKKQYDFMKDPKIHKLAQENARYLISVFTPTHMIYTTSLRQINYLASFMISYINDADYQNPFEKKLALSMIPFVNELERLKVLDEGLLKNEKERKLSLFGKNLDQKDIYYGDIYATRYQASLAEYAQAQRHRTLDYQLEFLKEKKFYIPPIIENKQEIVDNWIKDMNQVKEFTPQGELVTVYETGKYEDFLLKCKERLCSAPQLEIMRQTRDTLLEYKKALEEKNHPLKEDIEKYSHGARCTFPDFTCTSDCEFKEGKTLTRKI